MMKTFVLGGVAALAMTGAALAQPADGRFGPRVDQNARISQTEFVEQRTARLVAMDADGDGVVSAEEMRAHRQARGAEMRGRMFERMDADGDGVVTRAEYDAAHEQRRTRSAERGERGGAQGQWRGHRGARHAGMRLDRGAEGVNIAQARQRAAERFAAMDADGDGYVTGAEMQAYRDARRAQHQARRAERRAAAATE